MNAIDNIKKIRLEKGIPQKKIADALNLDNAVISNIENGKRELKFRGLGFMAICLEVSFLDLFTYPDKYVPLKNIDDEIAATLTIQLKREKKDQVLKLVFGDNNLEILNK